MTSGVATSVNGSQATRLTWLLLGTSHDTENAMQRRTMMAGLTACLVATGYLAISAMASPVDAWSRQGSVTGPRGGTTTWERSGSCSGGTCTRSGSVTGPGGNTVTRETTVTRNGNSWERDVKVTGPNGGTWTRDGHGSCSGGTCTFGGTVTGPRGNTGTYSGTSGPAP
jgi:hypothetical protein